MLSRTARAKRRTALALYYTHLNLQLSGTFSRVQDRKPLQRLHSRLRAPHADVGCVR